MRPSFVAAAVTAFALIGGVQCGSAWSQTPGAGQPGVITGGSESVMINGKPAARQGDTTTGGALIEGSPNVFINGKPATVIGDRNGCGSAIVSGGHGVFINGKPMARQGDQTSGCAK
ncbi:MAG: PAAR domain-containing protein [Rhizobiales bacterium]|nr:PAAR domain-containing protein [Hyphomicrobiales bacterium]